MNDIHDLIGGKTVDELYADRDLIEGGFAVLQPCLKYLCGVFIARLDGHIMFIGKGAGKLGLSKRLYDLRRPGDSGRRHYGGQRINDYLDRLELCVIVTGVGPKAGREATKLRNALIARHTPTWNVVEQEKRKAARIRSKVTKLKVVQPAKPGSAAKLRVPVKRPLAA